MQTVFISDRVLRGNRTFSRGHATGANNEGELRAESPKFFFEGHSFPWGVIPPVILLKETMLADLIKTVN